MSKRVLVILPPHVPSYFNAGHHMVLFQVGAYLRRQPGVSYVRCLDGAVLNVNWKEIADLLFNERFDFIAVMNEQESLESMKRFLRYVKQLSGQSKTIAFGRYSNQIPAFFRRYDFDAVVHNGDYEAAIAGWIQDPEGDIPGVAVRTSDGWRAPSRPGVFVPPSEWAMPDIREIPYAAYERMYSRDSDKFCGIPQRLELVVAAVRGCPVQCEFCDVPAREGIKERRMTVEATIRYIEDSFAAMPFEYVSMYAPTFTLNRRWVVEFCEALLAGPRRYPWKCTTTIRHLDEELVALMAASGCVRISVGLETLDRGAQALLPRVKRTEAQLFDEVAKWCSTHGIELNCFVILGIPGTSLEGMQATVDHVRSTGARVRPTMYTPWHKLRADMDEEDLMEFNRQLFTSDTRPEDALEIYRLYFGREPRPTVSTGRIAPVAR